LPSWFSTIEKNKQEETTPTKKKSGDIHLQLARESLSELLNDKRVPETIRRSLQDDYEKLRVMLTKLENSQLHIAVFGRVSVGK
jgi:uncharacterized protein (UPF0147 family)